MYKSLAEFSKPRVVALGDLLLDLVVRYDPERGEVDFAADGVQMWPGGSAANFAVWAARLGAEVRFISRVGRDLQGDLLVRSMAQEGVTTSVRTIEGEATGRVLVMVDDKGSRRMWSYPGASASIAPEDLEAEWFDGLDAFHLTGYSLLRDGPRAAAMEALRMARSGGATLCTLDPNPPHLIADFGTERYRSVLERLQFDIIFPNYEEGALLTGLVDKGEIARGLLALSPVVALTLGEEGCMVATRDEVIEVQAEKEGQAVDATGAGDAFAAGFVVEYLRTGELRTAAWAANRVAGGVVGRIGAR
jgi:sugar/nucleoside kinase (ribokinase family)